jgi:hypothetical protein
MPDDAKDNPDQINIDWSQVKPGPIFVQEAFQAFGWQEWEGHVRRIAREVIDAEPFPETHVHCGCGFTAHCYDATLTHKLLVDHNCFQPISGDSLPDPWHKSLARLGTNVVGWAAIAFILHTFIDRLLDF